MRKFVCASILAVIASAPFMSCSATPEPPPEGVDRAPETADRGPLAELGGIKTPIPALATQTTFASGSLIIPMDIDYQNSGMLKAFGLLYQLLLADVPVSWCVLDSKSLYTGTTQFPTAAQAGSSIDFTTSAVDVATNAVITSHGYRGGPFVIDAANATAALAVITKWNSPKATVTVHKASASFVAPVSRQLINAPTIGINNDGNAPIAIGYLNAAGIPDSTGAAFTTSSPDVLTPAQVAGPSYTVNNDGALFGKNGYPVYCQLMSMHWTVQRTAQNDAAIAEMKSYLEYPTHLFAECQAVNMIEDDVNGHFVSTDNGTGEPATSVQCFKTPDNGLCAATQPTTYTFLQSALPFAQLDGPFQSVGGSEPGYGLSPGSTYYDNGIVMIRASTAATVGVDDVWMTGFAGGGCAIYDVPGDGHHPKPALDCNALGKVSYLGGHQYNTNTPITMNAQSQGTRLFLNSLFEAGCVTTEGQPSMDLAKVAPPSTATSQITFELDWSNGGPGVAVAGTITDPLPPGATFVSATSGGTLSGNTVIWTLNDIGPGTSGKVYVTVNLASQGTYQNVGTINYKVGNNKKSLDSNQTTTVYCVPATTCPSPDNCGTIPDGCGGTVSCGPACSGTQTCGGAGVPNVCGTPPCMPLLGCPAPDNCGSISDGCGGMVSCGTCTSSYVCGAGGVANVCGGCTPLTACPSPDNCGVMPDGCGGTVDCGPLACAGTATCGGGGTPNVCGAGSCTPQTACPSSYECGTASDGCGGVLICGTSGGNCTGGLVCNGNVCGTSLTDAGAGDSGGGSSGDAGGASSSSSSSGGTDAGTSSSSSSSGGTDAGTSSSSSGSTGDDAGTSSSSSSSSSSGSSDAGTSSSSSGGTGGTGGATTSSGTTSGTGGSTASSSGLAGGSTGGSGGSGNNAPNSQGACKCRAAGGESPTPTPGVLALGVLGLALARRRRRQLTRHPQS
jgi:MYXO-CTERM domain-containing protein/uncharacterized repeat protein (TIGR01451 family)